MLLRRPGFFAVTAVILGLGIGSNAAILSVINAVLLRPLSYTEPERLVWIEEQNLSSKITEEPLSGPNFDDYRRQSVSFVDVGGYMPWQPILSTAGEPERVLAAQATPSLFRVLGTDPMAGGRLFAEEEGVPGKNRVVLLSYGLWNRRFGANPAIVGQSITLNNIAFTVVGVMPRDFRHPSYDFEQPTELWIPLGLDPKQMVRRADFLWVIARLKPGVEISQAQADAATISARLSQEYPDSNNGWVATVTPLQEHFTGKIRADMLLLMGAVAVLLLIACANVANLLLVRSTTRWKEIAVRKALGASRWRIARQMLTESVLLALAGGVIGVLLAWWGLRILITYVPSDVPRIGETQLDPLVLVVTVVISLVTGIVFGLIPAVQSSKTDADESLNEGSRSNSQGGAGATIRNGLMITEVALALCLLVTAGLIIRSFVRLQNVDPGFKSDRLLTIELSLPASTYQQPEQWIQFYSRVLENAGNLPGVQEAGLVTVVPPSSQLSVVQFYVEGRPPVPSGQIDSAQAQQVSPSYFDTMGIQLLDGRVFTEQDVASSEPVAVIDEVMASRYWPEENSIGKRFSFSDPEKGPWISVVGVVRQVRQASLDAKPFPQVYASYRQGAVMQAALLVRTQIDPISMVPAIKNAVAEVDKNQPLYNVRTMEQIIYKSIGAQRLKMLLISIVTAVAVLLAAIGLYGVISFSVSQRSREIGIRMALGAERRNIMQMVMKQGLLLVLIGLAAGLIASFALGKVMGRFVFGISVTDPLTFVLVSGLLVLVAVLSCYLPARRATQVNPVVALRYE